VNPAFAQGPMLAIFTRLFDVAVVTLIFSALT
jgi:hypothetical protein